MKILIATSVRAYRNNNRLYITSPFAAVLKRYGEFFDDIELCTRVIDSETIKETLVDVTNIVKDIIPLNKLSDVLKPKNQKLFQNEVDKCDLIVVRVPSLVGYKMSDVARKLNKPYFCEVVACAWDAYWNHSLQGKFLAPYMFFKMKSITKKADYALYVTKEFLQKRYPTNGKFVGISDVKIKEISEEVVSKRLEKAKNADKRNLTLMTSAVVNVKYKGQEYVIKAIKHLKESGINATYKLAGGGSNKRLLKIAKRCGIEENVVFLGSLSHEEVFENLDKTDVYIQPSLTEGMPRALIEAISRGCICIGTKTGGIPELLQFGFTFRKKSKKDIANAIKSICEKKDWETIIKENFENAREFEEEKLNKKRNEFYKMVKEEVER